LIFGRNFGRRKWEGQNMEAYLKSKCSESLRARITL
jgi:hypothetical protein